LKNEADLFELASFLFLSKDFYLYFVFSNYELLIMKKIFKMLLYIFIVLICFTLGLVIFLNFYYTKLEKKEIQTSKEMADRPHNSMISTDSTGMQTRIDVLNLIPVPQKVSFTGGYHIFKPDIVYSVHDSLQSKVNDFLKMIPDVSARYSETGADIQFRYRIDLPYQGYTMNIKPDRIIVEYSNQQGLYYSIVSLKVLNHNYSGKIPCISITDAPDLDVRGLMLDISRDKVPTLETLLSIAQLLADLKYNHFELYVEGFSFAYPSFMNLWEGKETPVTGEEIKVLDTFCRTHFIDLAANQNSLGHMMAWLATDQYKDLAECPKGYKIMGLVNMKGTLDPVDPRSFELVTGMTEDLLPNFSSANFNVNLDEPFELGKGKSKKLCEEKGEGEVYLEYALKLHDLMVSKNKKVMMWGDIVMRHPELIPRIPKDITLLDWGYESSYPYERHCKTLQEAGLGYMVCPGTNSWTSITGRTENMISTIEVAATNGVKYGAKGMLLTDWGDMGHWQYLPVSYPGYTVGGALSWNNKSRKEMPLSSFLNSYVFRDDSYEMGDLSLDLGRYNRFEEFPMFNMTTTMMALQFGLRDKIMVTAIFEKIIKGINDMMKDLAPEMIDAFKENYDNRHQFDYPGLQKFIDSKELLLQKVRIRSADGQLIHDEYENALRLIRLGAGIQSFMDFRDKMSISEQKTQLKSLKVIGERYLEENKRLWLLRNKSGGYDRSTSVLNTLMNQINERIVLLDKSFLARSFNRFLEKVGTAGAVLYIRSAGS
jgi:hexosaminidase